MLFLCRSALYRAGVGWHGNAINKTAFRCACPNFKRPLLRAICFFCGVKKGPAVYRAADQHLQYQTELAGYAGYGLVTKFSSRITNSSESKRKTKLMRSGGISDEDALNHLFPFTLVVNNHKGRDS